MTVAVATSGIGPPGKIRIAPVRPADCHTNVGERQLRCDEERRP